MDSHLSDLLIVIFAVSIPSAAGVFIYWLRLRAQRLARLDEARDPEVEALQARMGELEERVEFAERVLAQLRQPEQLSPPPRPSE